MRHRFHALCPYFAMFPETFAGDWIGRLTRPGDIVLDPFCGRGTAPFQSLLMGRRAVALDVNHVAYCITRAKTNAPEIGVVRRRLTMLEHGYTAADWDGQIDLLPEFFHVAYTRATLGQLVYLRSRLHWKKSAVDCMIAALVLGCLHGESKVSPSYLSNQMPRTISTKPAYSLKYWRSHAYRAPDRDAFALLRDRLAYRYETPPPRGAASVHHLDMRELPRIIERESGPIRCVITSPPYLDVTNFEEDQWLRLWFLGRPPRPTYGEISRDDRHERPERYWGLIGDMWRVLGLVLARGANIIIRIGARKLSPDQIVAQLSASAAFTKRTVSLLSYKVSEIKKRQTGSFRPGSKGCLVELDFHFQMR